MKKEEINTNSLAHIKRNCKYHIVFSPQSIFFTTEYNFLIFSLGLL